MTWEGFKWGKATPCDVDLAIELDNQLFIFGEAKHERARFGGGQDLFMRRVIDAIQAGGKTAYYLRLTHNQPTCEDVDLNKCKVIGVYHQGEWYKSESENPKKVIDYLIEKAGLKKRLK